MKWLPPGVPFFKQASICSLLLPILVFSSPEESAAQSRLPGMPGYAQHDRVGDQIRESVTLGALSVTWDEDGKGFEYVWDSGEYHYDISKKAPTRLGDAPEDSGPSRGRRPARGRQFRRHPLTAAISLSMRTVTFGSGTKTDKPRSS